MIELRLNIKDASLLKDGLKSLVHMTNDPREKELKQTFEMLIIELDSKIKLAEEGKVK